MRTRLRLQGPVLAAALAAALAGHASLIGGAAPLAAEDAAAGKAHGLPAAQLFYEEYDGPPVAGAIATQAPAVAPLLPGNRTHEVRLDVVVRRVEVAPGVAFNAWTFGGMVPGPVLHVREGDRVVVTMKNRSDEAVTVSAPMPHSIDFHAAMTAPTDKYRAVKPGQTIRFEWVADYPGVYMYHCGTPPVLQHVAMGQYGVVIVSPRDGYPTDREVAREYAVVQSEFYLKPGHDDLYVGDPDHAQRRTPSHVAFNGRVDALHDPPLTASVGDRIRLYLLNAGPNDTASSHVVGTILDRVYYEGNPNNEWHGLQTLLLGASSGAVVEFVIPEAGEYLLVDHEFADAQKGAVLRIRAGDPASAAAAPPMAISSDEP